MRILMASTELWPLAKVGGLADMVGSLARAIAGEGHDVRCALPAYNTATAALPEDAKIASKHTVTLDAAGFRARVSLRLVESDALPAPLWLVDHPLLGRDGIYDDPGTRQGYADNGLRWALFCRAVHSALGADGWTPEIVHAHDHQAAPLLGLLRFTALPGGLKRRPGMVFTLHNVGYQGIQPRSWIAASGLPEHLHYPAGPLEFHGNVNLMKIGIHAADRITTVSPRYALEIAAGEEFGRGLEADLAGRRDRLTGILNGIDAVVWDPAADRHLPFRYSADRTANKARNRSALRDEIGLEQTRTPVPLLAMITRLTPQKGVDLALPVLEALVDGGVQAVVLGAGEERYEGAVRAASGRHPGRLAARIGFDEPLSHRIEAGADIFVMPSRYEPCGLNQMYSLRYGTIPVVRAVGGLADTVSDLDEYPERANGFVFRLWEEVELFKAVHRAVRAWRDRGLWRTLVRRGMTTDFSWARPAREYLRVYESALSDAGRT
jgi:starch synthase